MRRFLLLETVLLNRRRSYNDGLVRAIASSLYGDGGEKYYVWAEDPQDVNLEPAFHMTVAYEALWDEINGHGAAVPGVASSCLETVLCCAAA